MLIYGGFYYPNGTEELRPKDNPKDLSIMYNSLARTEQDRIRTKYWFKKLNELKNAVVIAKGIPLINFVLSFLYQVY